MQQSVQNFPNVQTMTTSEKYSNNDKFRKMFTFFQMFKQWQVQKSIYSFVNVQTLTSSEKCLQFSKCSNNNKFRKIFTF